ncbi:MAG: pilus assembly PilX family protein, partial [Terriglobia bacterium]
MQSNRNQSGVALIVTLLTLTVFALMMLGFFFMVNGQQQIAGSERDNTIAFYGAEAALENMSYQVANLFAHTTSPTPAQLAVLDGEPPPIPSVTFPPVGSGMPNGGYYIGYTPNGSGGILSNPGTIGGTGPLAGLQGAITPLTLTAIADGPNRTEVKLIRQVQEVDVPVFEFGIFSNNDLSFFAGPDFKFGGRVATNGDLYLAEGSGATLTFPDKVTAFGNVIRTQLSNGFATSAGYPGTVNVVTSPGSFRSLAQNEGSLVGGPGSAPTPNWKTISLTDYNGNIENSATGVKKLNMAFAVPGSGNQPINIIERAPLAEDPTSPLGQARLENQASMRILLSDSVNDLPDGANAVSLSAPFPSTWYPSDACHAVVAVSPGPSQDADFLTPAGTSLLGGFIEVDIQNAAGAWINVTQAVLDQGITNDNPGPGLPCVAGGKSYYPIL